jgi:hypothetical protein
MALTRHNKNIATGILEDRLVNIDVVASAYASVIGDKAYLTMPLTTGLRYYEVLERYHCRDAETLEWLWPGALFGEVILPNLEAGRSLAERLAPEINASLICPGIFDGRRQHWTQEEYMALWLRVIDSLIGEIYLSDGWEYTNGGAAEFARALAIQCRFVEGRDDRIPIFDHRRQPVDLMEASHRLIAAIKNLDRRGFSTVALRQALTQVAGVAAFESDFLTDRREREFHFGHVYSRFNGAPIVIAAQAIGVSASLAT